MQYRVNVVFSRDKDGYFAFCPELPGCHSQGENFEDARMNIKEAMDLYLETMSKEEITAALDKDVLTTIMEVNVA